MTAFPDVCRTLEVPSDLPRTFDPHTVEYSHIREALAEHFAAEECDQCGGPMRPGRFGPYCPRCD